MKGDQLASNILALIAFALIIGAVVEVVRWALR